MIVCPSASLQEHLPLSTLSVAFVCCTLGRVCLNQSRTRCMRPCSGRAWTELPVRISCERNDMPACAESVSASSVSGRILGLCSFTRYPCAWLIWDTDVPSISLCFESPLATGPNSSSRSIPICETERETSQGRPSIRIGRVMDRRRLREANVMLRAAEHSHIGLGKACHPACSKLSQSNAVQWSHQVTSA